MTGSKELVLRTIEEKKTGRIPVDYMPAYKTDSALREYLDLPADAMGERELLDYLGVDLYYLSARDISQNEGYHTCWKRKPDMTETERTCALGIRWKREVHHAKFSVDESIHSPLEDASCASDILQYDWPKRSDFDFSLLCEEAEEFSDKAVVGGLWTGILGDAYRLVGFQNFLLKIALYPELIHALVKKLTDVYLELNDSYFQTLKGKMDIWFFGNDFGTQNGLLLSLPMWREFFLSPIQQLCDLAHSYRLKVMMHSCGSVVPIIEDLIGAGVEILDPVQVTAKDMDPVILAERYGDSLVFHGGIDTQQILPFGREDDVIRHCDETVEIFTSSSGYIASGSQIFESDIPLKNIFAVYNEIKRLNNEM